MPIVTLHDKTREKDDGNLNLAAALSILEEDIVTRVKRLRPPRSTDPVIYWEAQGKDRMCALHSLNSLLQGPVYTESDLSAVALALDEKERGLLNPDLAKIGASSDIAKLLQGGSTNVSDDGFFSLMVLEECLRVQGYKTLRASSTEMRGALLNPGSEEAFMCNFHEHWFTVRRVHGVWYNLDSLKKAPLRCDIQQITALLSDVISRSYSVFVIRPMYSGINLPIPKRTAAVQLNANQFLLTDSQIEELARMEAASADNVLASNASSSKESANLKMFSGVGRALDKPQSLSDSSLTNPLVEDNPDLLKALQLSLEDYYKTLPSPPPEPSSSCPSNETLTIRIRLRKQIQITRMFFKKDPIVALCYWLEKDSSIGLQADQGYILTASFSKRELRRFNRYSVIVCKGDEQSENMENDVSSLPLGDLFPTSQLLVMTFL